MKKNVILALIFSALFIIISSCKKEDDNRISQKESESKSYLMIDDKKYELDKAYVYPMQTWENKNYLRLFLFSKNVSYSSFMGGFIGEGAGLRTLFDFPLPTITLPEGTYTYIYQKEFPYKGTNFSECEFSSNVNWWMPSAFRLLKTGTITVAKAGTTYTIELSGTDTYDKDIKCYYKGTITELDGVSNLF